MIKKKYTNLFWCIDPCAPSWMSLTFSSSEVKGVVITDDLGGWLDRVWVWEESRRFFGVDLCRGEGILNLSGFFAVDLKFNIKEKKTVKVFIN